MSSDYTCTPEEANSTVQSIGQPVIGPLTAIQGLGGQQSHYIVICDCENTPTKAIHTSVSKGTNYCLKWWLKRRLGSHMQRGLFVPYVQCMVSYCTVQHHIRIVNLSNLLQ